MATKSELLELARKMERYPENMSGRWDGQIHADSEEWKIIIDALRAAAEAQTVPA